MLSAELNDRLTRVGPGTPAGQFLRHYWHPVAAAAGVGAGQVVPVRLLGEDLVLFRDQGGVLGLLPARCPHRGASLALGFVEGDLLRCAYHGWAFDRLGRCLSTPNEPEQSRLGQLASLGPYAVTERAGLVFAHLGGGQHQGITGIDVLTAPGAVIVRTDVLPCNWLQIAENGMDPVHLEWLHGHLLNAQARQRGEPEPFLVRRHAELEFERTPYGMVKRRRLDGQESGGEDWDIGQQLIFPGILYHANAEFRGLQFRTPVDDEHTLHVWWEWRQADRDSVEVQPSKARRPDGSFDMEEIDGQDSAIWVSQGPILDRTNERLGVADHGVTLYRRILLEQIDLVAEGGTPINCDLDEVIPLPPRSHTTAVLVRR